jgi:hypothetical protein
VKVHALTGSATSASVGQTCVHGQVWRNCNHCGLGGPFSAPATTHSAYICVQVPASPDSCAVEVVSGNFHWLSRSAHQRQSDGGVMGLRRTGSQNAARQSQCRVDGSCSSTRCAEAMRDTAGGCWAMRSHPLLISLRSGARMYIMASATHVDDTLTWCGSQRSGRVHRDRSHTAAPCPRADTETGAGRTYTTADDATYHRSGLQALRRNRHDVVLQR